MNAIYLHPVDGFTFLENVPEKPKLCPIPKQDNCKEFEDERGCECTYLVKTYERALTEAIEKRIPVLNPGVVFTTFKRFQEGEIYQWPGTWEKTQIEITCPDGIEGCEVYHTKTVVILSAPKEEKQKVMIIDDLPNVKELVNSDMSYTEGSEPVNSSMSEKEDKKLQPGLVMQTFGDGSISGPFIMRELPTGDDPYWCRRVNLFKENGQWSHVAHIDTLEPVVSQDQEEQAKHVSYSRPLIQPCKLARKCLDVEEGGEMCNMSKRCTRDYRGELEAEIILSEDLIVAFAKWYSGMDETKVRNAYRRYKEEVLSRKPID